MRRGDMTRQIVSAFLLIVVLLLCACSSPEVKIDEPQAVPYEFVIERADSPEYGLAEKFNKYIVQDDFYTVVKVTRGFRFPQLFPDVFFLTAEFEDDAPQRRALVAYDTTSGRFYPMPPTDMLTGFNGLLADKLEKPLKDKDVYYIAASLIAMKYSARALALRKEDLLLDQYLRKYINATFTPKPGKPQDEFNRDWWGWQAYPSVNSQYRAFFSAFRDSLADTEFLREVPPDVVGPPEIRKDGHDYYVTIRGLPPGTARRVQRYDFRISEDGQVLDIASANAFVY